MKVKGLTVHQLNEALRNVNKEYGYDLIWNREPEWQGNFLVFTIRSRTSKIPGAKTSWSGRASISASWHSHGYLFDAIFEICPDAIIKSLTKTITIDGGNWQDYNVGSMMQPQYASEQSIL